MNTVTKLNTTTTITELGDKRLRLVPKHKREGMISRLTIDEDGFLINYRMNWDTGVSGLLWLASDFCQNTTVFSFKGEI